MGITQDGNPESKRETRPAVSVVVISKDRHDDLVKCVASLREMDYPDDRLEIVVVEEGDAPTSLDGVNYVFIPRENRGWGYARNVGIKNASHDVIAFADDDCVVTREWLSTLVGSVREDVGGVTGGVLVKDCNAIGYCENVLGFPNGGLLRIHRSRNQVQETVNLSTCNCLYKREVFETVGYFFEAMNTRGTDTELAKRVTPRYKCLFNPRAVVYHKPRGRFSRIFKWFVARGESEVFLLSNVVNRREHLRYSLKRSLLIRLGVLALVLYFVGPVRWRLLLALIAAYYVVILIRYSFQFRYFKRLDCLLLTPLVKLTMDVGMEVGLVRGVFGALIRRMKRRVRPEQQGSEDKRA